MEKNKQKCIESQNQLQKNNPFYQYETLITKKIKENAFIIFRKNILKEMNSDKPEYIQTICIANNINFKKMIDWIQEMQREINQKYQSVQTESLNRIEFKDSQSKKQIHFLTIKSFSSEILCAVLRNYQGDIVLYQKIEANSKIQYILRILENYSLCSSLILYDQTGNETDSLCLFQQQNNKYRFVYILNKPICIQFISEFKDLFTFHSENNISVFYPKELTINQKFLQQKIYQLYEFENQEASRFQEVLGKNHLSHYKDRFFFLSRLIKEKIKMSSQGGMKDYVTNYLNQSTLYLKQILSRKSQLVKCHLPKRHQIKNICYFCRKKKTETACQGCFKIYNQIRHFCVGNCFRSYHEYMQSLELQLNFEAPIYIKQFDQKCKRIQETMGELLKLEKGSQVVESFIKMTNSKLVHFLNQYTQFNLQNEIGRQ